MLVNLGMVCPNDVLQDARVVSSLERMREHHHFEERASDGPHVDFLRVGEAHMHLRREV